MSLVDIETGTDSWLLSYESCEDLARNIFQKLSNRDKLVPTSSTHIQITSQIRQHIHQYQQELQQLKQLLMQQTSSGQLTSRESERRSRLIEGLNSKEYQLIKMSENRNSEETRGTLLGGGIADLGATGWGEETEETRGKSVGELHQQQKQIMKEQDAGLEALSVVISRQKDMARGIGQEVEVQNEIIDDITDHMDRTNERLLTESRHIRVVSRKDGTCGYWVVILLLFIAIIIVVAIPKKGS